MCALYAICQRTSFDLLLHLSHLEIRNAFDYINKWKVLSLVQCVAYDMLSLCNGWKLWLICCEDCVWSHSLIYVLCAVYCRSREDKILNAEYSCAVICVQIFGRHFTEEKTEHHQLFYRNSRFSVFKNSNYRTSVGAIILFFDFLVSWTKTPLNIKNDAVEFSMV